MTAHKHAEMIKAKADNMDLVVFVKRFPYWEMDDRFPPSAQDIKERWFLATDFQWEEDAEYFLCLPQHKEACLHWLNGGGVQYRHGKSQDWDSYGPIKTWTAGSIFMQGCVDIRIKPHKEKRWIAVNSFGDVMPVHCKDLESAKQLVQYKDVGINGEVQYIEIEVEV